jgi:hypothetical protein
MIEEGSEMAAANSVSAERTERVPVKCKHADFPGLVCANCRERKAIAAISSEWIAETKEGVEECNRLMRQMLERSERMAEDMRVIRRCVMGDD